MRPALTVVLIVIGAAVATVLGLLLAAAMTSNDPDEFFNVYLMIFVVAVGGGGGLLVGGASAIVWSVVATRSRVVRATCTGLAALVFMTLGVVLVSYPTGGVGSLLLMFLPSGVLAAITTASVAALARQPTGDPGL
jgi:hypothetical protein